MTKQMVFRVCALALMLLILSGGVAAAQDVPATGALPEAARTVFMGSKEDPAAKKLLGVNEDYEGRSYLTGDEWHLQLFYPKLKGIGGGYMGVGSDQAYLLMSWSRPSLGWITDYDPLVIETHKIYFSFFKKAKTPEEFLKLWEKESREEVKALLASDYKDDENLPIVQKIYKTWRVKMLRRHSRIKKIMDKEKIPCYLNDQESYDHIRNMVEQGRIRPLSANLLDDEGLVGIGQTAKKLNVPIRVLYLSNAEEYWNYPEQYRKNIQALHFDERSYTLHTLSTWSTNKDYRYAIQPSLKYAQWLTHDWVKKVYYMIPRRKLEGAEDIDFMEFDTDVEDVAKRRKKKTKK